jgi:hypothetical protein
VRLGACAAGSGAKAKAGEASSKVETPMEARHRDDLEGILTVCAIAGRADERRSQLPV